MYLLFVFVVLLCLVKLGNLVIETTKRKYLQKQLVDCCFLFQLFILSWITSCDTTIPQYNQMSLYLICGDVECYFSKNFFLKFTIFTFFIDFSTIFLNKTIASNKTKTGCWYHDDNNASTSIKTFFYVSLENRLFEQSVLKCI